MNELPVWLKDAFPATPDVDLVGLSGRLILAVILGGIVAAVYRWTQQRGAPSTPSFVATLVLLSVIIAMVTQVVGESVGRAFTLVGALSIVRFRTVVEDTRDTAFVIFAVVVGMASGLGNLPVALVGLAVVSTAAALLFLVQHATLAGQVEWTLQLRVSTGAGAAMPWEDVLAKYCEQVQLRSTATARQGAALDLLYAVRLRASATPMQLLHEINRFEGMQNVELKRMQ